MTTSTELNKAIRTYRKDIEKLDKQIKLLQERQRSLVNKEQELEAQRDEQLKQEFIQTNGVTKCPDATNQNSKPSKKSNKGGNKQKSNDSKFDSLKNVLANMSEEEREQLLAQYSDSCSDEPQKPNRQDYQVY